VAELAAAGGLSLGEQVALANLTLARQLEQLGPPVGQVVGGRFRIVGVILDAQLEGPDRAIEPTLFHVLPPPAAPAVVMVRLAPGRSIEDVGMPAVLARIWGPRASRPFPVDEAITLPSGESRARTFLLGLVSLLSIPLAALGIVGALTFAVTQRTRDIAIHLAIGAKPGHIERRVIRRALAGAALAITAGLSTGIGLGRLMRATLFGVAALDPSAIAASIVFVLVVVWVAALVPARRASRIDPVRALRDA
jgi:putative ABC transport system permease protein